MSELICPCAVLLLQSCVVVSIAEVKRTVPIPMEVGVSCCIMGSALVVTEYVQGNLSKKLSISQLI